MRLVWLSALGCVRTLLIERNKPSTFFLRRPLFLSFRLNHRKLSYGKTFLHASMNHGRFYPDLFKWSPLYAMGISRIKKDRSFLAFLSHTMLAFSRAFSKQNPHYLPMCPSETYMLIILFYIQSVIMNQMVQRQRTWAVQGRGRDAVDREGQLRRSNNVYLRFLLWGDGRGERGCTLNYSNYLSLVSLSIHWLKITSIKSYCSDTGWNPRWRNAGPKLVAPQQRIAV